MHKTLNIAVDIRYLRIAQTGTRTYLEELCKEFKKLQCDELKFYFLDSGLPIYTGTNKILKWVEHLRYQAWKQVILPINAFLKNSDIVFCADDCVPLLHFGYKTIPVMHDAFCFESPENYGKLWLWLYKKTAVNAAKNSPFIITPTIYSQKQIARFIPSIQEKLVVVYEGAKTLSFINDPNYATQFLNSLSLIKSSYLLHVGAMYKRKNLPALVTAFAQLKQKGHQNLKLVLAGPTLVNKNGSDYQEILSTIETLSIKDHVIITGYLSDQSLSILYQNALLYVFPSVNEGFGIPILEAFKNNIPVLIANNTCLPEIGGDAAVEFDPFNIDEMSMKIKYVLDNPTLQKDMIAKGQQRIKIFTWENTALSLIEIFKKAAVKN